MRSRTLWGLIALAVALICGGVDAGVRAQGGPLTITLEGPAVCETDVEFIDFDVDTVPVGWTVSGGSPPYEILIDGEIFNQSSGEVEVVCGRRHRGYGRHQITSGITTVQAAVTDATGRSAAALHDLYSIRVIRHKDGAPSWLDGGETFRVHGLLFTVPNEISPSLGRYLSADCSAPDEHCGDRFRLGDVWINRWAGTEYSRSFRDSSRGIHLVVRPGDDVEIPERFRQRNEIYDQLIASIGEPPNGYADVRRGGSASGRMSLKLEVPAICNSSGDVTIPVAWSVAGGREPYEVTIEGDRYLGQRGVTDVDCLGALDKPRDSGRRHVQATAVDANGDTVSSRADLYVIEPRGRWQPDLTPGATYNLGRIGLITVPQDVEATIGATEHELCAEPWPVETSNCEPGLILTIGVGNGAASIVYGSQSGREYDRSIPDGAPPALISALGQMLASIDAPPQLPDDFVDASGPLQLAVFAEPGACAARGRLSFHWTASGGRWWPLRVEVDGRPPNAVDSNSFEIFCDHPLGSREVQIRVVESGSDPQTITQTHTVNVVASRPWLGSLRFLDSSRCTAGQPLNVQWEPSSGAASEARFAVTLGGAEKIVGSYETFQLRCPAIAGSHLLIVRPLDAPASQLEDAWSTVVRAENARPERAD